MANTPVRVRIKTLSHEMSKNDAKIADYILKNIKNVSRSSISDLSNTLGLADSTVFQFTKKLGYKGFTDFKIALLTEEFDPETSIHERISKNDSEFDIAKKVFDSSIRAIEDTKSLIDKTAYTKAVDIMSRAKKVTFFGFGGSNAVALDSYHKFLRSPITCNYTSDSHIQLMNAALFSKDDCAFIISHTGKSKEAILVAKTAKNKGAKIIVLTSYPLSPLAKEADVLLVSTSEEVTYRSESLSSRLSQLSIIDAIFVICMFRNESKAKESLSRIRYVVSETKTK